MSIQNLPLLDLFTRLQKAGLSLGIDEYLLVLRALQAGFGIADHASLKRLCRTLWVKSADEDRLFDYHFKHLMPEVSPQLTSEIDTSDSPSDTASKRADTSEITVSAGDEVQIAQAALQSMSIDDEIPPIHFISMDEYFPVTRRQMKQSWRYLRYPVREGPPVELDVEATVSEIGRKGILLEPILIPRRINRAELLLLIDHGGSMMPFHILSHRLIESALRGGRLGRADIYYFHNCPVEYLSRDPAHQEYELIDLMLNHFSQRTGVLVFSDAGAARGGFSQERIDLTKEFLKRIGQYFRYIVWLNPMPRSRWPNTTADEVRRYVPMFDLSRRGLDDSISVLRGRPSQLVHPLRHNYNE